MLERRKAGTASTWARWRGIEELSQPYEFDITLRGGAGKDPADLIDASAMELVDPAGARYSRTVASKTMGYDNAACTCE